MNLGHDPRELFYTRIFKERGFGENDPSRVKIFRLSEEGISPVRSPGELKRFRLGVNLHTHRETGERLFW